MRASDRADHFRAEVNKRLTLNWLVQGASIHAGRTIHHLAREELAAICPPLQRMYDQFGVALQLQYWRGEMALWKLIGRLFRTVFFRPQNPIPGYRLMEKYQRLLSRAAKQRTLARAKEKGVVRVPGAFSFYVFFLVTRLSSVERPHRQKLETLASKTAAEAFGISADRLCGKLVDPGSLDRSGFGPADSPKSVYLQIGMVSWNRVRFEEGVARVHAQAINGMLLMAELVKGTAELICLNGLCDLDEETYLQVIEAADKLNYEPAMIETGGELWRRLLLALPTGISVAQVLMQLSLLAPDELEALVESVILELPEAGKLLQQLCDDREW